MINYGAKNVTAGLILAFDPFLTDKRYCTALGCGLYNGSTDGVVNIVNQQVYSFSNKVYSKNKNYFTAFAIDYPEGSYGGDAAGREGLTPGLNVRSGAKTYEADRALHLWAWNELTNSWIADTYFTGAYLSGHCYKQINLQLITITSKLHFQMLRLLPWGHIVPTPILQIV
jgi:hypothetical protein